MNWFDFFGERPYRSPKWISGQVPPMSNPQVPPVRVPVAPPPIADRFERIRRARDELAAALGEMDRECFIEMQSIPVKTYADATDVFKYSITIRIRGKDEIV
jgi:hypothetical protein